MDALAKPLIALASTSGTTHPRLKTGQTIGLRIR